MNDEDMEKLNHITDETIKDDIMYTNAEIEDIETELSLLKMNPLRNKVDIYMRKGKISERKSFIEKLESILDYRIRIETLWTINYTAQKRLQKC